MSEWEIPVEHLPVDKCEIAGLITKHTTIAAPLDISDIGFNFDNVVCVCNGYAIKITMRGAK